MSSRHRILEPYGRWHATIHIDFYVCVPLEKLNSVLFKPTCANAQWVHMHQFASVCLSVRLSIRLWLDRNSVDNNSYHKNGMNVFLFFLCVVGGLSLTSIAGHVHVNDLNLATQILVFSCQTCSIYAMKQLGITRFQTFWSEPILTPEK